MVLRFDIFRVIETSQPVFQESASTLDEAKIWVRKFSQLHPGVYVIVNRITGEKISIKIEPGQIQ